MKRQFIIVVLTFGLFLGLSPLASATTWYVLCDGLPPHGIGTPGDPYNTVQAGLNACGPGDEVEVADGT